MQGMNFIVGAQHAILKKESELKPNPGIVKLKEKCRSPSDTLKP